MNALIVFTHPDRSSLNGAMLRQAEAGLEANPRIDEIRILDLYEHRFDPALRFGGEKRRRDMHVDPELAEYRGLIQWADLIVFIYPIWWGRPPAMLLGFFDQILSSGFAYHHPPGRLVPNGLLKGKSAVCIYTMKGPGFYPRLLLRDSHRIMMRRAVLRFVGIRNVRFLGFGGMESSSGRQDGALRKVAVRMEKLTA